jgi:hypothetical protein
MVCEIAVTWELAMRMSTFGWKNTLVMLDMLDVVNCRRQCALELGRHAAGHLIRRQAGVLPDDGDHRDSDIWKDIDGRAQSGERTNYKDDQREHDEGIRPPQGDADDGNHAAGAPKSRPVFV